MRADVHSPSSAQAEARLRDKRLADALAENMALTAQMRDMPSPPQSGVSVGEAADVAADDGKVSPTSVIDAQTSIFCGGKYGAVSPPETSPAVSRQTSPKQSDGAAPATVILSPLRLGLFQRSQTHLVYHPASCNKPLYCSHSCLLPSCRFILVWKHGVR
jgi:hypothetical protein